MQAVEHNAQHSFLQKYKNLYSCTQEISLANLPKTHNYLQQFFYLHSYYNLMLYWSMKILPQQETQEIEHLQLKRKFQIPKLKIKIQLSDVTKERKSKF